ncbi:RtcB family protein [Nanoarchaeota archaeon]
MNVPTRVFTSEKMLKKMQQDRTLEQGKNVACLPGIYKYACVMPDGHEGYGFPIGGVAALDFKTGGISPGGIGYDINCGVRLLRTNLTKEQIYPKIKELLDTLFELVPAGLGSANIRVDSEQLNQILDKGSQWAVDNNYGTKEDMDHCEESGYMKTADHKAVSEKAKSRGRKQVATLGSGNHFLEIQYVDQIYDEKTANSFGIEKKDQVTVMIHCGSRGLGHQVCSDYLREMERTFPDIIKKIPDKELIYAPADHPLAEKYLKAMSAAANFAWCNRHVIAHQVRLAFKKIFPESELKTVYDVAHNICKVEEHNINNKPTKVYMHRKGATRAFGPSRKELPKAYQGVGQPIILPGSMGTGSYLLVGTDQGMEETFGSTAHGAGRVMSRHEALRKFRGEDVKKELEQQKILVKAASWKGIAEEAPGVYKDVDEVVEISHKANIGRKVVRVRPIGVIKG